MLNSWIVHGFYAKDNKVETIWMYWQANLWMLHEPSTLLGSSHCFRKLQRPLGIYCGSAHWRNNWTFCLQLPAYHWNRGEERCWSMKNMLFIFVFIARGEFDLISHLHVIEEFVVFLVSFLHEIGEHESSPIQWFRELWSHDQNSNFLSCFVMLLELFYILIAIVRLVA